MVDGRPSSSTSAPSASSEPPNRARQKRWLTRARRRRSPASSAEKLLPCRGSMPSSGNRLGETLAPWTRCVSPSCVSVNATLSKTAMSRKLRLWRRHSSTFQNADRFSRRSWLGVSVHSMTSSSGNGYGSGRNSTVFNTLNITTLTPTARASVPAATAENTGFRRIARNAPRVSWRSASAEAQPQASRVSSRVSVTLPKSRRAAARASSGDIPAATRSSVSRARWKRISSSSSDSCRRHRQSERSRTRICRHIIM